MHANRSSACFLNVLLLPAAHVHFQHVRHMQVSAHGTGAGIPPVDEQVVAMTLVTPGQGTLQLSAEQDPELFRLARVGLGALGVVTDVTLQCVPVHRLLEHTFVASAKVRAYAKR